MRLVFIGLILMWVALGLSGCGEKETVWGDLPFIEMEQETIVLSEQVELCDREPSSVFCKTTYSVGFKPDSEYVISILKEMNSNFTYMEDDTWHYNQTVSEYLRGDCEDIASTMAQHMINDGVDKKHLYLVYRLTSETTAHLFLAVDTSDRGLLHLDYDNSGYPIEEQINYHLPLNDVRAWIKGNIN